ncbi:penicillin-binding protein 1B [Litorivivens lipolytica]|uniref:Penicillin-binding protein 1B n=1 Tax=Litorivivens lipolytica TaxID=1524264 RepID=A0A7W4W629_9GAMM|nr:penicillin-binding protein 1B [Litorivivens lipolytica]MBB3048161.1 penicillin-binding protein 1B [Litorivivens lipolytica]
MPKKKSSARKRQPRRFFRFQTLFKLFVVFSVVAFAFLIYCDIQVRSAFSDVRWQQPAKVYARPLILAPGVPLTPQELEYELGLLGYQNDSRLRYPGSYYRQQMTFALHYRDFAFPDQQRQAGRVLVHFSGDSVRRVEAMGGEPLEEVVLEPTVIGGIYPNVQEDRLLVRLENTPRMLVEVLLQVEDKQFYEHFGISPRGIARAMLANLKAGRTVQGGSTITQQLVKNVLLTRERSLWRKFQEMVMALLLEVHYSKDEILEAYINQVYLGQEGSRAIHGFALAARHYYNKPLEELNLAQTAMLVGLVKGPSYYAPWRHEQRAKERRNLVLAELAEAGWLSQAQLKVQQAQSLQLAKSSALEGVFPAYVDLVRRQLRRDYRNADLATEGLRVFTPFDPLVQRHAEQALTATLDGFGSRQSELQGAMTVTSVDNADVIAMVGGRRPRFAGFNRALDALRPVGSLIKPAIYLTALQEPHSYTLSTFIDDNPIAVKNPDGSLWKPTNYDEEFHGRVMLHEALSRSYNLAAARLGLELGIDKVLLTLKKLGVQRPLPAVPAMLLGAAELSPIEVHAMYQTLAANGRLQSLRAIYAVTDSRGQLLARYPQKPRQTVDQAAVHLLQYAMIETVREGTGKAVYQSLPADYRVAGKTGTSNDFRDSWFSGFAGDYAATVWLGNDDNSPTGLTGSAGALKAWRQFMAGASRQPMPFQPVEGVTYRWIDPENGRGSHAWCEGARQMPFIGGSWPTQESPRCVRTLPNIFQWFRNVFD